MQLTTSDAFNSSVAEADRSHRVAERALAAAIGEPVETTVRAIALAPELPEIIDRWMQRYEPDMVVFHVSGFWYCYPSVPLRLERKFGRAGKQVAKIGTGAGKSSWIAERRAYHWGRWLARRTIGGAYFYTPEQVVDATADCLRRILGRNEDVALVVRGNMLGRKDSPRDRELAVHNAMTRLADELHFTWMSRDFSAPARADAYLRTGDRFHSGTELQRIQGELEAAGMIKAWQHHHSESPIVNRQS